MVINTLLYITFLRLFLERKELQQSMTHAIPARGHLEMNDLH